MKKLSLILALILVMALPGLAGAWTYIQEFRNDYGDANAIYLWMDTPEVTFGPTTFGVGHPGWQLAVNTQTQQYMYGPAISPPAGGIYVTFNAPRLKHSPSNGRKSTGMT